MTAPGLGSRRRVVLAVEDDDEVFALIRSALTDLGSGLHVQRVRSGRDGLQFLGKISPYERAETPQLVIIDTAAFVRDEWPSLAEMRRHVQLQSLPVVVVGTQPASHHGMNASALGTQFYILNSVD